MTRNVLLLEDQPSVQDNISRIINSLGRNIKIICADNIKDGYSIAIEQQIHLFVVDIILEPENSGDISGLKFVQEIRNINRYKFVPVIFVTSLEDPKLWSYSQLGCLGYIEKPFNELQVKKYVLKALDFPVITDSDRHIYFRKDGIAYAKCVSDIYFIEISRRKITLYCSNDVLEIPYKTCKEIMQELGSPAFIQCSRYIIINKNYIENIDYARRLIKLKNIDRLIEIGPIMKNKFREEMESL